VSEPRQPAEREARLRPEFSALYPGLPAGEWRRASLLTDIIWARLLERGKAAFQLRDRVLDPEHFEFRLGAPASPGGARRRTDTPPDR
jgi:hypothetical protein